MEAGQKPLGGGDSREQRKLGRTRSRPRRAALQDSRTWETTAGSSLTEPTAARPKGRRLTWRPLKDWSPRGKNPESKLEEKWRLCSWVCADMQPPERLAWERKSPGSISYSRQGKADGKQGYLAVKKQGQRNTQDVRNIPLSTDTANGGKRENQAQQAPRARRPRQQVDAQA